MNDEIGKTDGGLANVTSLCAVREMKGCRGGDKFIPLVNAAMAFDEIAFNAEKDKLAKDTTLGSILDTIEMVERQLYAFDVMFPDAGLFQSCDAVEIIDVENDAPLDYPSVHLIYFLGDCVVHFKGFALEGNVSPDKYHNEKICNKGEVVGGQDISDDTDTMRTLFSRFAIHHNGGYGIEGESASFTDVKIKNGYCQFLLTNIRDAKL